MFHCLDVLCVNLFILYQQASLADVRVTNKKNIADHKSFTKTLILSLIDRANKAKFSGSSDSGSDSEDNEPAPVREARPNIDRNNPSLTIYNQWRIPCDQTAAVTAPTPSWCRYCSYQMALDRLIGAPQNLRRRKTRTWCSHCKVNLCSGCFIAFHTEE